LVSQLGVVVVQSTCGQFVVQKLIPAITHTKICPFTQFFLEMGCPKHSLHAHIDFLWPG